MAICARIRNTVEHPLKFNLNIENIIQTHLDIIIIMNLLE